MTSISQHLYCEDRFGHSFIYPKTTRKDPSVAAWESEQIAAFPEDKVKRLAPGQSSGQSAFSAQVAALNKARNEKRRKMIADMKRRNGQG